MTKYSILTLVLLNAVLISCNKENKTNEEVSTTQECLSEAIKNTLDVEKVTLRPIERSITLNGYIDYNQDKTVPYHSLVDGLVANTYFSLGDYVAKGQLLAEIKSTDTNEIYTELKASEAELKVATRELESVEAMYKDGIASQKELLEAQEDVKALKSKVSAAKSSMAIFNTHGESGIVKVVAPQAGYIVTKSISTGMTVNAGDEPLFTIADLSDVWIMANVYTANMRHIQPNQEVKVSTLAYPDEYFAGKVTKVSQVFDTEERVLKARISMENKEMKLKPGMSADIIIQLETNEGKSLAIPNSAIIFDNNQNYVVIYKNDCEQEVRKITPQSKNSIYTYINEGVKENEMVVTTNELLIYEQLNNKL
ncbi:MULTISPECIES: efflux RND transporter periplasmic adaptor subunit [Myroides]|uniref:Cation transporter n=2 Tax=Myroides odoratimimus TaxID=76832 RepID=A0AAI8C7A6_9FLAO|nr:MULTISPECIES: efflux RND transporter periplasmic adaptor subunit [Myroides]ALU27251.1 cation transporter [Myroides odoratimimus]EHO08401.1 efflux transporter, RND family, MFP subunit [Myroides odoratimimus CCUG 10230]MCA4807037.1 efflux RND transporter periplasmic adaptor subunit [Myroides odoratimimus]MCO7722775.1 efflux RND transporter periplasmic adaptor subunit [Myroides odoratimimus]MCS7473854.1 efflux RND transporter periplasmic adaptor subunit [Myroides odoratimimus]